MEAVDAVLESACEGLVANWGAHTVLLYGSRADGTETEDSDYDLAAFAPVEGTIRDASVRMGSFLDLFIYPDSVLHEPTEEHLKLRGSKVLLQRGAEADAFLRRLDDLYQRGPETLPLDEIEARRIWALKMVSRIRRQDIEGAYRRVWLLTALLEDYFVIRGLWFEGPKKAFRWLDQHDLVAARAFTAALARNAGLEEIQELAMVVIGQNGQVSRQSA
jgi:predicted nucleotidyltransferase